MNDTSISRRRYLIGMCMAALFVVALRTEQAPAPNVIVILADDMGWADLGPESNIDTPHLDQLAKEGVTLSRFYASAPICSPTRAALLTGRYPHSVGVPELAAPQAQYGVPRLSLNHSAVTIPEALKPKGYASILVGKWHLGFDQSVGREHTDSMSSGARWPAHQTTTMYRAVITTRNRSKSPDTTQTPSPTRPSIT